MSKPARVPARLTATALVLVGILVACTGSPGAASPAGAGGGSGSPSATAVPGSPAASPPSPPVSPSPGAIDHPTGAGQIVLRAGTRGGFIGLETVMSRVPEFTLYGDGRALILPDDQAAATGGGLNPAAGGTGPGAPPALREVRLGEEQVQALLEYALTDGGLGTARDAYLGGIMDAPSTVFDVDAGGVDRSILVTGLTSDPAPGPDAAAIRAFASLLAKLRAIGTTGDYTTDRVVAVIGETEPAPGSGVHDWPWPDLAPSDFVQPPDDAAVPFPTKLLDASQAAVVAGQVGTPAAISTVRGPDGKVVRPRPPRRAAGGAGRVLSRGAARPATGRRQPSRGGSRSQSASGAAGPAAPERADVHAPGWTAEDGRTPPGCGLDRASATASVDR